MSNLTILTVEEAAEAVKKHPQTMYGYVRSGTVPAYKIGREWRIVLEELLEVTRYEPAAHPSLPDVPDDAATTAERADQAGELYLKWKAEN